MFTTARLDLAVYVFKSDELSGRHARSGFTQIRVERKMLNLLLLEITFVIGLERRAVHAAAVVGVPAEIRIFLSLDATVELEELNINGVFGDGRCLLLC